MRRLHRWLLSVVALFFVDFLAIASAAAPAKTSWPQIRFELNLGKIQLTSLDGTLATAEAPTPSGGGSN